MIIGFPPWAMRIASPLTILSPHSRISLSVISEGISMSYFTPAELPDNKYYIFGKEGGKRLAKEAKVSLLGQIPLVERICESGDDGNPVALDDNSIVAKAFEQLAENVARQVAIRNETMAPTVPVKTHD